MWNSVKAGGGKPGTSAPNMWVSLRGRPDLGARASAQGGCLRSFARAALPGLAVLALLSAPAAAGASDRRYDVDVTTEDAVAALNALAAQTGHLLLFDFDQVEGLESNPVSGRLTLTEALSAMLEGTGLQGQLSEREVISILPDSTQRENTQDDTMTFKGKTALVTSASAALLAAASQPALAQDVDAGDVSVTDEVISVGTRSARPRSALDSPVPVDAIDADTFTTFGGTVDITDNLKTLVPSYNALPATGDGSAFVRPTSLRGTAPDQTLVLVNGKRRHRSALVQFFAPAAGNGAHGPDVGLIPSIALKRVEVLRDGAAAQYGSDAIAGVINFVTRDAPEGGEIDVRYGQHYEGEENYKIGANIGLPIGPNGFFNISGEYFDNEALSRGFQRPDAAALVEAGVPGIGADTPFDDEPFAQTWGRPESSGLRLFANLGFEVGESAEVYAFGNYGETDGTYRFFYRNPNHPSLATLRDEFGYSGSLLNTGYTPFLEGEQQDLSVVLGFKGEFADDILYDFSASYGENELDYTLFNTTNPTLGLGPDGAPAQRDFDPGALKQDEFNLNADFSKLITPNINLAVGAEYREETYTIRPGERNSFIGAGSNGLRGFSDNDAGSFARDNYAVYADVEHDITDDLLLQYAVRYEDFSDFGDTINWKVAGRYNIGDAFALRGAVSTGFHAPTPGQANIRTTITTFDGRTGRQVEEGLVPATSVAARSVGGAPLVEETSTNYSIGGTADLFGNTNVTLDFYQIDVEDRIYRTGDIALPDAPGSTISFYTNALDVEHQGVDLVVNTRFDASDTISSNVTLAASYNSIDVTGQNAVGGINPVSEAVIEDIENNYPEFKGVLSVDTSIGSRLNWLVRANYTGEHFDERGRIGAETNPSAEIDPVIYFDTEVGYDVTEELTLAVGAANIFDSFPDEIGEGNANRLSVGLPYPRRSAANYEGGSWYVRARYNF